MRIEGKLFDMDMIRRHVRHYKCSTLGCDCYENEVWLEKNKKENIIKTVWKSWRLLTPSYDGFDADDHYFTYLENNWDTEKLYACESMEEFKVLDKKNRRNEYQREYRRKKRLLVQKAKEASSLVEENQMLYEEEDEENTAYETRKDQYLYTMNLLWKARDRRLSI